MNEQKYWQAVQQRDAAMDGSFLYGVITTGIYCKPSCASRQPLRKNVRFYTDPAAAEAEFVNRQPLGRLGRPIEIAHAIAYAASTEAEFMTGSVVVIDGGMTM